jgi:rubredoxin
MKIIEHGASDGWWIGKTLKCLCGVVVELEKGDPVKEYRGEPGVQIYVPCPECRKELRLYFQR